MNVQFNVQDKELYGRKAIFLWSRRP